MSDLARSTPQYEPSPTDDEIQFVFDQCARAEPADADRLDDIIDRMLRKQFMRRQEARRLGRLTPSEKRLTYEVAQTIKGHPKECMCELCRPDL
jgi:hypothetical protein